MRRLPLTSDGVALTYALNADGTVLTASAGVRTVFTVELFDDATGSYRFTLLDNLDHPTADTEDDLVLNFTFTATDSDGDNADSSFQVTVDDDGPVIGAPVASSVDEEGLGGNAGDSYPDPVSGRGVAGDLAGTATIATGVLNIGFGADDTDAAADGATQDTPGGNGNRSVTFTDTTVGNAGNNVVDATGAPLALTSDGVALTYALNADGTVLTASAGVRTVFTVELFDDATGSYRFTLLDNLDHPTADTEDDLVLNFTFYGKPTAMETMRIRRSR